MEYTYERREAKLIADRNHRDKLQVRRYCQGDTLRWGAFGVSLVSSIIIVLTADTTWARAASVLPILASAVINLDLVNPFAARSGWHYRRRCEVEQLLLEVAKKELPPLEIQQRRIDLAKRMGDVYPQTRLRPPTHTAS